MSVQRTHKKHIPIKYTKEKEYNNTWQKHDNTYWTIGIWEKTTTLYSSFICVI